MNNDRVIVGRILAVIEACEEEIAKTKYSADKINAVITAYERIVKILKEYDL